MHQNKNFTKMKLVFLSALLISICLQAMSQHTDQTYNKALADSLGADERGMKSYVFVILKTGPEDANIRDKPTRDRLFAGHFSNMDKMAKAGQLIVAGPIGQNDKTYRGLFILNVKTVEEAEALAQTDPAIQAGIFAIECYSWYGSAALPMYLPYADKVAKNPPL
jgi:uncharacterized protein